MDGSLISQSQRTGCGLGCVLSSPGPDLTAPFPPYPECRCDSTQRCQLNHACRSQRPIAVLEYEGSEQVQGTVGRLVYIRGVPGDQVGVGLCHWMAGRACKSGLQE